jgi:hypothetical protein
LPLLEMGYDTKVYLVYGVPFYYDANTKSDREWLLDLMVPDEVKENGKREWWLLERRPHTNGYLLFDFPNDGILILGCWWATQGVESIRDGPQILDMPTEYSKAGFVSWCLNHNVDTENIGFYMVTNEE